LEQAWRDPGSRAGRRRDLGGLLLSSWCQ